MLNRRLQKCRAGFTVTELLVSIAIVGLLLALLLPAVQSVRESSRRTTCRSHIKQVILGALQYEASFQVYPNTLWATQLLPYVEGGEGELFPPELYPPLYFCPSDPAVTRLFHFMTNYDINTGVGMVAPGFSNAFETFNFRQPSEMTDGMSTTAAFSERLVLPDWAPRAVGPTTHVESWPRRLLRTPSTPNVDEFADECEFRALPPAAGWFLYLGYTHNLPPNRNSCINGSGLQYIGFAVTTKSFHSGSVNTAFADGSVRTTSNSIDRKVWRALGTRQGGETVGEW